MSTTRRSLIIGAGLATAAPALVKADSIMDIPWDMRAAQRWAVEQFSEYPGMRVVFSDGSTTKWYSYPNLYSVNRKAYIVAMEACVTDVQGRRAINTIPVDGAGLHEMKINKFRNDAIKEMRRRLASLG